MTIHDQLEIEPANADFEALDYLTRREAAALCRVPLSTFDSLRRQNRFPFPDAHMGKHMLWRSATVHAFLQAGGTRVA
ncbi:helix-turn-helix transcriptional regulator [Microbacterium aurum]